MAKTRPGLERITKQFLQSDKGRALNDMETHERQCLQCNQAKGSVHSRCDVWWELARRAHKARRKLRQYEVDETANMDMLPGF